MDGLWFSLRTRARLPVATVTYEHLISRSRYARLIDCAFAVYARWAVTYVTVCGLFYTVTVTPTLLDTHTHLVYAGYTLDTVVHTRCRLRWIRCLVTVTLRLVTHAPPQLHTHPHTAVTRLRFIPTPRGWILPRHCRGCYDFTIYTPHTRAVARIAFTHIHPFGLRVCYAFWTLTRFFAGCVYQLRYGLDGRTRLWLHAHTDVLPDTHTHAVTGHTHVVTRTVYRAHGFCHTPARLDYVYTDGCSPVAVEHTVARSLRSGYYAYTLRLPNTVTHTHGLRFTTHPLTRYAYIPVTHLLRALPRDFTRAGPRAGLRCH